MSSEHHLGGFVNIGGTVMHLNLGYPVIIMPCKARDQLFEFHPYCGPMACNEDCSECEKPPRDFYKQVDMWCRGGRMMDGDRCVVPENCKACKGTGSEVEMFSKRSGVVKGDCKTCGGAGFIFPESKKESE